MISLWLALALHASPRSYDTLVVRRVNNLGVEARVKLEFTDAGYLYNGIPLPATHALTLGPALKTLRPRATGRTPARKCPAGTGELTRTQGKIISIEKFCLNDVRGQEVHEALAPLTQQARLALALRSRK